MLTQGARIVFYRILSHYNSLKVNTILNISDHCNYSYAEVEITELNTETRVISTTNAAFKNVQAIWKIKFQDAEGADINVTSVTIVGDDMLS